MKNFQTVLIILLLLIAGSAVSLAQPVLKVFPDTLKYTNTFERLQHLLIYNDGSEEISIDSIYIDKSIYHARFDRDPVFPIIIQPADSLVMDCIFWNYWSYTYGAYDSSVIIYSDASNNITPIGSEINLNNTSPGYGEIIGTVTSGNNPVQNAKVFFYRNGTVLTDSAVTNGEGNYSISPLAGNYFAAVEKEGFNLSYYSQRVSPVDADFIELKENSTLNINFDLTQVSPTGLSIRGNIFDRFSGGLAKKERSGIVIASKGDHNPSKISHTKNGNVKIFTGIIYSDGSYSIENIQEPGYYYILAFSEFYIPGYYAESQNSALFWQDADSVLIEGELSDYNIYLERDSSYGGGVISGKVNSNLDSNFVNTIVYAQASNGIVYTHNFVDANGNYKITGLPYGEYRVVAQLIDYENAVSSSIKIDQENSVATGVDLEFSVTNIDEPNSLPVDFRLYQNYPNPFNPETVISFSLDKNSFITLKVYDVLGNEVTTLINGNKEAGFHKINFSTSNLSSSGGSISSGVYFYRLQSANQISAKKMVLLR